LPSTAHARNDAGTGTSGSAGAESQLRRPGDGDNRPPKLLPPGAQHRGGGDAWRWSSEPAML